MHIEPCHALSSILLHMLYYCRILWAACGCDAQAAAEPAVRQCSALRQSPANHHSWNAWSSCCPSCILWPCPTADSISSPPPSCPSLHLPHSSWCAQAQAPSTSEAHPATRSSAAHPHSDSSTSGPDRSTRSSRQGSTASSSVGSTLFDRTSANVGLTLRASQVLQRHYQATLASSTVTEAADETGSASTAATVAGEHGSSSGASKPSEAHGEAAATAERPGSAARHSHISGDEAGAEEGRRGWDTVAESAAHTTGDAGLRQLGSLPEVDDALPEAAESGRSAGAAGGQAEPRSGVVVRAGKSIGRTQGVQGERGSDLLAAMDDLWLGQGQKADPYTRSTVG